MNLHSIHNSCSVINGCSSKGGFLFQGSLEGLTMSQVYTSSAISRGEVPVREDFQTTTSLFREAIIGIHQDLGRAIPAATIFGSCASGHYNVCSDVDLIILVDDSWSLHKDKIFKRVRSFELFTHAMKKANECFVQVSVYPVILSELRSKKTKNDRQFLKHVTKAASCGGLICGDQSSFITFFNAAPEHTPLRATSYIERKIEKLEQRLFCYSGLSQEEEARMWLDTYQAPFHAIRRLFDLVGIIGHDDNKKGILSAFSDVASARCSVALRNLMNCWKAYISYVESSRSHAGKIRSPFLIEDVEDALIVLNEVQRLLEKMTGDHVYTITKSA